MKRYDRWALVVLLVLAVASLLWGLNAVLCSFANPGNWIATAGLLSTLAGVVQLEVSGL